MRRVITLTLFTMVAACSCQAQPKKEVSVMNVRPSVIAGSWYPGNPDTLTDEISRYLDLARASDQPGGLAALIVPHAGYAYSGPVAAFAYKNLVGREIRTVVMVGPNHAFPYRTNYLASVYGKGAWETPLGKVEIDESLSSKIINQDTSYFHNSPDVHAEEHSLEIQLPFLQSVLPSGFKIVPIMMLDTTGKTSEQMAKYLAAVLKNESDVLLLASTDLSHYHSDQEAKILDKHVVEDVSDFNGNRLLKHLRENICEACGGWPVVTVMIATKLLGADKSVIYNYRTSGDVVGDRGRVVGYLAAGLYNSKIKNSKSKIQNENQKTETGKLTLEEKKELFRIARASVEAAVKGKSKPKPTALTPTLGEERGVFVTLKIHGNLRGCIGYIEAIKPLCQAVSDMASAAAVDDPRFPSVTERELGQLEYEISVLTPKRQINDPSEFIVGKHGIIVQRDGRGGVFLPQVAPEEGWNREETLTYLCTHKAGLPGDAWKDKKTKLYVFEAEVIEEKDLQ